MRCHNQFLNKRRSCKSLNVVGSCWNAVILTLNLDLADSLKQKYLVTKNLPDRTKSLWSIRICPRWSFCKNIWSIGLTCDPMLLDINQTKDFLFQLVKIWGFLKWLVSGQLLTYYSWRHEDMTCSSQSQVAVLLEQCLPGLAVHVWQDKDEPILQCWLHLAKAGNKL